MKFDRLPEVLKNRLPSSRKRVIVPKNIKGLMSGAAVVPLNDINPKDNDNGMAGLETTTTSTRNKLNVNLYATKKTVAQGMLDIALLTANVAQLKYVLLTKGSHQFYTSMMWFISISIVLQILVGIGQLVLVSLNINHLHKQKIANMVNNVVTIMVFIITVINVIISAFGIEDGGHIPTVPTVPT